ncbi:Cytochrome c oxidase assembly protein COX16, mitochondrial [Cyberlindnera fabianii]|uniref:Cytochrome c oxidase assembly protein COX16, mitochondrial n=1 Tax=Cyberlindnera fabianii TaxID=36022 RepID=A0A1V2L1P4_CYBFA|nr:Cytochrome c oxidase assembly protein COX16, mitochondrial [Cyberlindnera fabianii]
MGLASVWLSSFTAVRYENRDRKTQELGEEEILKLNTKKKICLGEDDWEPKRVPRLPGESDNVF